MLRCPQFFTGCEDTNWRWNLLIKSERKRRKVSHGGASQWAERRKVGAAGEKKRACHPPSAKPVPFSSPPVSHSSFPASTLFPLQPPASYFQPAACTRLRALTCVWVSAYQRWGWGGLGGRAIKALLKHFWCCWPTLQLKEGERKKKEERRKKKKPQSKGSETVREVERECAHTQRRARHA